MSPDGHRPPGAAAAAEGDEERSASWVSAGPGDGALPREEAVKDEQIRRWDVVTPSATKIGRAKRPEDDLSENLRRLHEEQHPAMQGHSTRMHRLEKARIAQAICNALDVTRWERDRVLGILDELDLRAFGSQRGIPKVTLVVVQYVVDRERRSRLGLDDHEWVSQRSEAELESLYERYTSIKDEPEYQSLLDEHDLTKTNVNRLNRVLRDQLDEQDLHDAVFGRRPFRDPNLPSIGASEDGGEDGGAVNGDADARSGDDGAGDSDAGTGDSDGRDAVGFDEFDPDERDGSSR